MDGEQTMNIGMTSAATYQIVLIGRVEQGWEDWFDGAQSQNERNDSGRPITTLNCRVRDQSELLGVLNRLNCLNFPILSLQLVSEEE